MDSFLLRKNQETKAPQSIGEGGYGSHPGGCADDKGRSSCYVGDPAPNFPTSQRLLVCSRIPFHKRPVLAAKHDPEWTKGKQKEMVPRKSLGRQEAMHLTMDCRLLRGKNCT